MELYRFVITFPWHGKGGGRTEAYLQLRRRHEFHIERRRCLCCRNQNSTITENIPDTRDIDKSHFDTNGSWLGEYAYFECFSAEYGIFTFRFVPIIATCSASDKVTSVQMLWTFQHSTLVEWTQISKLCEAHARSGIGNGTRTSGRSWAKRIDAKQSRKEGGGMEEIAST